MTDTAAPRRNRLWYVLGAVAVLVAVVVVSVLFQKAPGCDASGITDAVDEIVATSAPQGAALKGDAAKLKPIKDLVKVENQVETAYDEKADKRTCRAQVSLSLDGTAIFDKLLVEYVIEKSKSGYDVNLTTVR